MTPVLVIHTLSARGAALIADFEGKVNTLYHDPAGHCSIGIGHLVHRGNCDGSEPAEFKRGLSDQEVYDLFVVDAQRYVTAVNRLITVPLTQNQFDALVSFTYNLGEGALADSGLLRKLNASDYAGAAQEFAKWVRAGGVVLPGLVRRRAAEAELFVAAEVIEGEPMQEWMPGVEHVDRGGGTPVQTNGPTVIVLHTTETVNRASYSGTEPHFEIDRDGAIRQYISLARTAKALYNLGGGVETNRRRGRIIQFELVNRADQIADITDAQLDGLAEALRWVDTQLPFQRIAPPQGWFGSESASEDAASRFSFPQWEDYGGICGHQHVPENDHWDPGHFPLSRLLPRLGAGPTPAPQPDPQEEDMRIYDRFEVAPLDKLVVMLPDQGGDFPFTRTAVVVGAGPEPATCRLVVGNGIEGPGAQWRGLIEGADPENTVVKDRQQINLGPGDLVLEVENKSKTQPVGGAVLAE